MQNNFVKFFKHYQVLFSALLAIILLIGFAYWYKENGNKIMRTKNEVIEGVLVDQNFIGVKRVYPTSFNANDIERSVSSLIYEPLFRVDKNEKVIPVLAESYSKNNLEYTIKLKKDIKFSNGEVLNASDVVATFDTIRTKFGENASQKLLQSITYSAIDSNTIYIKLNSITPTFFEDLDFGIMPASKLNVLADQFIGFEISKDPIGTGPYKKLSEDSGQFKLVRNESYRNISDLKIETYTFKFFNSQTILEQHLLSGNITFTKSLRLNLLETITENELNKANSNLIDNESHAIPTRYWALYFNLKDSSLYSDTEKRVLPILQDENVRKAINIAINKEVLAGIVSSKTEIMQTAYPSTSWVNNSVNFQYFFDNTKAKEVLTNAGWKLNNLGLREKNGQTLSFKISYLQNPIRDKLVNEIVNELNIIGIKVTADPIIDNTIFNDSTIKTKQFEVLLLGMETYIDPDRARLWSESQISVEGLNISSYKSSQKVQDPITNKEISKVDDLLARARNTEDTALRAKLYLELQKIISDEVPVIFLYQPNFNLIQNKDLKLDITSASLPEEIYYNISSWQIQ